jgi:putative phage-type endonuclease
MKTHNFEQGSPEWLNFRLGKITGSKVKGVFGTKAAQSTLIDELIAEELTGTEDEIFQTVHMMRGVELEPFAIEAFEKETGEKCYNIGAIQSESMQMISHSPDGLIKNEKGEFYSGVEIKCPKSKTHIKYLRSNEVPKEYVGQCYLPFIIEPNLQSWFFVSYDPRVVARPLLIVPIIRAEIESELNEMEAKLIDFIELYESEKTKILF